MVSVGTVTSLQGMTELRAALKEAPRRTRRLLRDMLHESVEDVAANARANVPRKHPGTGALRASIKVNGRGMTWKAGIDEEVSWTDRWGRKHWPYVYGRWLERGTSKRPATPFMRPAADGERGRIEGRLRAVASRLEAEARQKG